ncbi:MAG: glycosyltransferase family 4 protein [Desulfovibrionaceae bacterium]|nr:glycosyltransferase family 4 protein [Desulfovibrionaceae bacterium]
MRICVLGNQARAAFLFWRVLMLKMRAQGHSVVCLLPPGDEENESRIRALDVEIQHYRLDRKGINPARDALTFCDLKRFFGREKVDVLFAYTIKPVIYGCMAAKMSGVPHIYATITGLGYAFEADSPLKKMVHGLSILLYRTALAGIEGVFFQNRDDAELFRSQGILSANARVLFANGTGVDTARFAEQPMPDADGGLIFLLVGRLLEAKGIREYIEAARLVKADHPETVFQILGPREQGLGSIGEEEIASWARDGVVSYLGQTADVVPYVRACHVLVLPSWREGLPTCVMEAMSMGRASLVTDVPGCREVVVSGKNGLIVPVRDPAALAGAMKKFIDNPDIVTQMGIAGRKMAEEKYDADVVASGILSSMHITSLSSDEDNHDK